jgi:hypothetical protein
MLRSEHIPFNLLAPLDCNRDAAVGVIARAFGIECAGIECIEIEYAPSPKERYLGDMTAFDTYIGVRTASGERWGVGIEVKYTEQAYAIGKTERARVEDHDSPYWQTARAAGCFINPDDPIFGTDALRQIWRNHLLGLAMVARGDIDQFYSITLFPNGNTHFHHVLPEYRALLKEEARGQVLGCTFETFIKAIAPRRGDLPCLDASFGRERPAEGLPPSPPGVVGKEDGDRECGREFDAWREWLWRRYVVRES